MLNFGTMCNVLDWRYMTLVGRSQPWNVYSNAYFWYEHASYG